MAAQGLLRDADPAMPATVGQLSDHDLLGSVIGQLINRAGVTEATDMLSRSSVTVSRFGAAPTDHLSLAACFAATITGEGLEYDYINLQNEQSRPHVSPQRMVLIKGEWYLIAWITRGLRTFRLARISNAKRRRDHPPGKPISITRHEVDALLSNGFYATASNKTEDRKKVILAVRPDAWQLIQKRRWGDKQEILENQSDLPPGWRRLIFVTTGIMECRHWVLSMGSAAQAEHPPELVQWVAEQATEMARMAKDRLQAVGQSSPAVLPDDATLGRRHREN